jgi:predicted ATPase
VKCYGFPDEAIAYYQNTGFLRLLPLELEKLLSRLFYLGPLREYPFRSYTWAGQKPSDVGRKGENAVPALLASRGEKSIGKGSGRARRYQDVDARVAEWLREMGLIDSFNLRPVAKDRRDYELRMRKSGESAEVLVTDVGFGVSQVLPVLTLCYYVPEGSIVILEQPEIHLHPSAQAHLADVLIDAAKTRNVQIILESHSEHLLRRLQRRIAENDNGFGRDDAALYFCRIDDGASVAEPLDVDLTGHVRNWPKDFFGDEMGDLVAMTEAAAKRREAK